MTSFQTLHICIYSLKEWLPGVLLKLVHAFYILLHMSLNLKRWLFKYSDQCGGQNRNIKLAAICNYITGSHNFTLEQIDHKFLVSGHSFLPCDHGLGVIEKQRKYNTEIWVPDDWATLSASAKKTEPKFQVIKMGSNDFKSTANLEKLITNRKEDISLPKEDRTKMQWLKIQWLRYIWSNPYKIYYKYTNNDDDSCRFDSVDMKKRKLGILPLSRT